MSDMQEPKKLDKEDACDINGIISTIGEAAEKLESAHRRSQQMCQIPDTIGVLLQYAKCLKVYQEQLEKWGVYA